LTVTGTLPSIGICASTVAPFAAATCSAMPRRPSMACCRMPGSKVRKVPCSSTLSGTMLWRAPPSTMPKLSTAGSVPMSSRRLTMVCAWVTICAAVTMGSTPCQGIAPCVWRPWTTSLKPSAPDSAGPGRTATVPALSVLITCMANMASGAKSRNTPSCSISGAPPCSPAGAPSSAGWNRNITSPDSSCRMPASTVARPSSMAVCASWPQACITPVDLPRYSPCAFEANGRSTSSVTGRASMSARIASFGPGWPPLRMPTTPVCAMPVRTSRPSFFSCAATSAAVRVSRLLSSGC
jgi:hypothetical protein